MWDPQGFWFTYLTNAEVCAIIRGYAGMAELADASDLGSDSFWVQVQVLLPVPWKKHLLSQVLFSVKFVPAERVKYAVASEIACGSEMRFAREGNEFYFTSTEGRYFTIHEVNYFTFGGAEYFTGYGCISVLWPRRQCRLPIIGCRHCCFFIYHSTVRFCIAICTMKRALARADALFSEIRPFKTSEILLLKTTFPYPKSKMQNTVDKFRPMRYNNRMDHYTSATPETPADERT